MYRCFMRRAYALVILMGCDRVFLLQHIPDASPCWDPDHVVHDEDGDGIADGCDICPADPDPMQTDDDGDGVGDACDPHRGMPGDHLVFFDPFETSDPRWTSVGAGAAWLIANGVATQSAMPTGYLILKDRTFHNPTVITFITGQAPGVSPTFAGAYAVIIDETASQAVNVGVTGNIEITDAGAFVQVSRPPGVLMSDYVTKPIATGTRARIAASADASCSGRYDDGVSVIAAVAAPSPPADGEIGLRTTSTAATFESVTVIETD
jgi:hypothetical protein